MIRLTHILIIIFGIVMLLLTFNQFRKKKLNYLGFMIWSSVWIILIAGILLFRVIERVATLFLNIRTFDLFVIVAILIIFILIFLLNSSINENRKKIEEIVEETAFREAKRK